MITSLCTYLSHSAGVLGSGGMLLILRNGGVKFQENIAKGSISLNRLIAKKWKRKNASNVGLEELVRHSKEYATRNEVSNDPLGLKMQWCCEE